MNSYLDLLNQLDPEEILKKAGKLGASYTDFRFQLNNSEQIQVENKMLQSYQSRNFGGFGIRVVVDGAVGYSSTSDFNKESVDNTLKAAFRSAKSYKSKRGIFADTKSAKFDEKIKIKKNSIDISPKEKVSLLLETNEAGWISDEIKNVISIMGSATEFRFFQNTNGTKAQLEIPIIGMAQLSVAMVNGNMEQMLDSEGSCSGYEFVEKTDWNDFAVDISELAIKTVKSKSPPAGTYPVVIDQQLVGVLIHEAFGHAVEADLVFTGTSALKDRLGVQLANEQVNVIDEGVTSYDGYHVPFDDEGVKKGKTVVLEKGILKSYLHDRNTANELGVEPTGNSRAQDFENQPQVRMTNTYVENGNYSFDELLEGVKEGVYIKNKGSTGGQVEVGIGTFTFNGGESYLIRNGELSDMVKGVVISGAFLENLKTVDAVGNDLKIVTNYFGACGKGGQTARVGFGGPHLRVQKMTIGGK
ncbi:MAG: TldD/PmbA family protein [Candidatus Heimdallarchaeota archaeon]|nr:TldD/PmbA family protein [Candidatus Heimdallarchaeota archaeon]